MKTHAELERLYNRAKRGDTAAEHELRIYAQQQSYIANKRLKSLEAHGYEKYAYEKAVGYTSAEYGGKRFRYDYISLPTVDDLYNNVRAMDKFLNSVTSTIRGYRHHRNETLELFRERGINIPKDRKLEEAFIQFLDDSSLKDQLSASYGSNAMFGYIADLLSPRNTRRRRLHKFLDLVQTNIDDADQFLKYPDIFEWDKNKKDYVRKKNENN